MTRSFTLLKFLKRQKPSKVQTICPILCQRYSFSYLHPKLVQKSPWKFRWSRAFPLQHLRTAKSPKSKRPTRSLSFRLKTWFLILSPVSCLRHLTWRTLKNLYDLKKLISKSRWESRLCPMSSWLLFASSLPLLRFWSKWIREEDLRASSRIFIQLRSYWTARSTTFWITQPHHAAKLFLKLRALTSLGSLKRLYSFWVHRLHLKACKL